MCLANKKVGKKMSALSRGEKRIIDRTVMDEGTCHRGIGFYSAVPFGKIGWERTHAPSALTWLEKEETRIY